MEKRIDIGTSPGTNREKVLSDIFCNTAAKKTKRLNEQRIISHYIYLVFSLIFCYINTGSSLNYGTTK